MKITKLHIRNHGSMSNVQVEMVGEMQAVSRTKTMLKSSHLPPKYMINQLRIHSLSAISA